MKPLSSIAAYMRPRHAPAPPTMSQIANLIRDTVQAMPPANPDDRATLEFVLPLLAANAATLDDSAANGKQLGGDFQRWLHIQSMVATIRDLCPDPEQDKALARLLPAIRALAPDRPAGMTWNQATLAIIANAQGYDCYERRPGAFQIIHPITHRDGDMVDIYLDDSPLGEDCIRLRDYGITRMRMSFVDHRRSDESAILARYSVAEADGELTTEAVRHDWQSAVRRMARCALELCGPETIQRDYGNQPVT